MKVAVPCAAALALFPFVSAFPAPAPTAGPGELDIIKRGLVVREARGLQPRQGGGTTRAPATAADPSPSPTAAQPTATPPTQQAPTTTSAPSSSSNPPSSSEQPARATSTSSTPSNPTTAPTTVSPIVRTSTSQTKIASTQDDGQVVTITSEIVVSSVETPKPSAPPSTPSNQDSGGGGVSSSTIIGLSVAGGLAALIAIAFIAWKLTRKRFSQFDTNDGAINWPDLQKDPEVVPPRAAPSASAASTTNSTTELAYDPYAVPPLPPQASGYRDDPSGFYDPYRGPVPQTFATPPASTDGHQQGWAVGEAIPMSTYASGRSSPGPNVAYGGAMDPMQRTGTPVQRMATPVQRMATPVQRAATPAGAATFQEIVRASTPGGGAVPYRTGTPGYGYGGR